MNATWPLRLCVSHYMIDHQDVHVGIGTEDYLIHMADCTYFNALKTTTSGFQGHVTLGQKICVLGIAELDIRTGKMPHRKHL